MGVKNKKNMKDGTIKPKRKFKLATTIALTLSALLAIFYKQVMVLAFIVGGWFIAPEASAILRHYCFGNGDTLVLDSSYLQRSYMINKVGRTLDNGESRKVFGFKQKYDWRLSYALNPFTMSKMNNRYHIEQWIEFDKSGKVVTVLNLGFIKLRVHDAIAHAFECTPFLVVCDFSNLTRTKKQAKHQIAP